MFQQPKCDGTECVVGDVLLVANRQMAAYLRSTNLADLHHIFEHTGDSERLVKIGDRDQYV